MKVFDLSSNSEVMLYTLREVGQRVSPSGYMGESFMKDLMNNPEIVTPPPDHTINGTEYWKQESIEVWARAYQELVDIENEKRRIKLVEGKIAFTDLVEVLINQVNAVKRLNHRAYKHNRGNSLQDARRRLLVLDGGVDFVTGVLASVDLNYTDEQRISIHQAIREMKAAVDMQ